MTKVSAIGIMSGTSLDGVDIAFCQFSGNFDSTGWKISMAETIPYAKVWREKLSKAPDLSADDLIKLDFEYGRMLGSLAKSFITRHQIEPDFIASHGHTIFHQPQKGYTLQIGHGAALAAESQHKVICDFRSLDVALGGQGAPLVPIGDRLLFGEYAACLNLGGFSNVSFENNGKRVAFDICPVNIALNHFTQMLGYDFDKGGQIAKSGKLNKKLFEKLNTLDYYQQSPPKSLGREWLEKVFLPVIESSNPEIPEILNTLTEHIARQIHESTKDMVQGKILITGGGAENLHLISRIKTYSNHEIVIPDKKLTHFKEALIFALLGYLRLKNQVNTLASVTGASRDSSGGTIYES